MRSLLLALFVVLVTSSCRDKVICSAFQSTYILDDSTRIAYYSYVWNLDQATRDKYIASLAEVSAPDSLKTDSLSMGDTPNRMETYFAHAGEYRYAIGDVRRSSFGIIKYEPMWLKNYKLKNAPMENVLAPKDDKPEEETYEDIGDFVATDFGSDSLMVADSSLVDLRPDSLKSDSTTVLAEIAEEEPVVPTGPQYLFGYDPEDDFNVEQEYYNKYFGTLLVYTPPKKRKEEEAVVSTDSTSVTPEEIIPADSAQANPKKGFFKNRKKKDTPPSEDPSVNEEEGINL